MLVNKKIIEELKILALKAKKNDEVPISAIIAKNDKIIFSAYNTCHKSNNPLNHAEMIVINNAIKFGAITNGVKIFNKKNSMFRPKIIGGIEEKFFSQLLKDFFKLKR